MVSPVRSHGSSAWFRRAVAVVCVLLVLLAGAAHLLHTHAVDEAPDAACSLCVVAHLSAAPAPMLHAPVLLQSNVFIRPPDLAPVPSRPVPFNLRVRPPPPATTAHA